MSVLESCTKLISNTTVKSFANYNCELDFYFISNIYVSKLYRQWLCRKPHLFSCNELSVVGFHRSYCRTHVQWTIVNCNLIFLTFVIQAACCFRFLKILWGCSNRTWIPLVIMTVKEDFELEVFCLFICFDDHWKTIVLVVLQLLHDFSRKWDADNGIGVGFWLIAWWWLRGNNWGVPWNYYNEGNQCDTVGIGYKPILWLHIYYKLL